MRNLYDGCCYGRHAEMDAIKKLCKNNKIKLKRHLTLIVIRLDNEGNLRNSTPCNKCIDYIQQFNNKRQHKIKHIYYSNADGNIEFSTINKLDTNNNKHKSKRFRSNH